MSQTSSSSKLFITTSLLLIIGISFQCGVDEKRKETENPDPKVEKLKLQPDFIAEHLYSPANNDQGSWVSMTFDDKGRLITSDQYGFLYRLQLPAIGEDSSMLKIERLNIGTDTVPPADSTKQKVGMGYAQGLLWAFNSLYVMVNHNSDSAFPKGSGLYRLQDTNGDDQFDKITLLKALEGEGEHGPHSVVLAPDKKSLYVVAGNHTNAPKMDAYRLPSNWQQDNLFPLIKDPRGHANDRMAPGGWVAKVDSSGEHWELISAGYRNSFDLAFNDAGDLFTYDSDMEWDFGLPWYRPTRICHVTSGSEYGWRTGNSKWSPAYPDNLPAILNIGQGSPTNLVSAKNAAFPEKYRESLFAFDWSFGIIYAIHLNPEGSSYTATAEEFVSGSPLPLTDGVIGPDGALYFLTGGRRLESDLYRVSYRNNGENQTKTASKQPSTEVLQAREIRRKLEQYHGRQDTGAVTFAWPYLKHEDRFIRYAARVAIEHQPVNQWQERALNEKDPQILTQAVIALARQGNSNLKNELLTSLMAIDYTKVPETQQQDILRAFELIFSRMGLPDASLKPKTIAYLDQQYPAKSNELNRSLSKLLVFLEAPRAVEKTMQLIAVAKDDNTAQKTVTESSDLILRNPQYGLDIANMLSKVPPAQQTYYATVLSEAETGWTQELQNKYFQWFHNAFSYKGGLSFIGFIDKARKSALQHVSKDRFAYFNTLSGDSLLNRSGIDLVKNVTQPEGPGRRWKMDEATALVDTLVNRDLERGKAMFAATLCISCHRMGGEGGAIGPDLSQLGTRFTAKDMLESIIEPNKVISDQYAATVFYLKNGGSVLGRLNNETADSYFISQNPFSPLTLREIPKKDVSRTTTSDVSLMLPGMINRLNEEELKDLIAYLMSAGNKDHAVYGGKKN